MFQQLKRVTDFLLDEVIRAIYDKKGEAGVQEYEDETQVTWEVTEEGEQVDEPSYSKSPNKRTGS